MRYKTLYIILLLVGLMSGGIFLVPMYQHWQMALLQKFQLQQQIEIAKKAAVLAVPQKNIKMIDSLQAVLKLTAEENIHLTLIKKADGDNRYQLQITGGYQQIINFITQLNLNFPVKISDLSLQKNNSAIDAMIKLTFMTEQMPAYLQQPITDNKDPFCLTQKKHVGYIRSDDASIALVQTNDQHIQLIKQ